MIRIESYRLRRGHRLWPRRRWCVQRSVGPHAWEVAYGLTRGSAIRNLKAHVRGL